MRDYEVIYKTNFLSLSFFIFFLFVISDSHPLFENQHNVVFSSWKVLKEEGKWFFYIGFLNGKSKKKIKYK